MASPMLNQLIKGFTQLSFRNTCSTIQRGKHTGHPINSSYIRVKYISPLEKNKKPSLRPLRLYKTGGRGENGRVFVNGHGGGHKQRYRMIDFTRHGYENGETKTEKVLNVQYDPCRTADIAIVAEGVKARYILASEKMKKGDLIKTHAKVSTEPVVRVAEGDAHPVGSLSVGTIIHNVELFPLKGGQVARAAGACGQIVKQMGEQTVVRMPSKREMIISNKCMCTIGRVSNVGQANIPIGSAGRARWFGIRPCSGLFQKKTGYHGRKIRPIKKPVEYKAPKAAPRAVFRYSR